MNQEELDQRKAEDEAWEEFMERGKAVAKLADALNALKDLKPLTEEEVKEVLRSVGWVFPDNIKTTDSEYSLKGVLEAYKRIVQVVRAVESAHGIKE